MCTITTVNNLGPASFSAIAAIVSATAAGITAYHFISQRRQNSVKELRSLLYDLVSTAYKHRMKILIAINDYEILNILLSNANEELKNKIEAENIDAHQFKSELEESKKIEDDIKKSSKNYQKIKIIIRTYQIKSFIINYQQFQQL